MLTFKAVLFSFASLLLLALDVGAQNNVAYTIVNRCPSTINLYIGSSLQGTLPSGKNITQSMSPNAGFFYTDANAGTTAGSATRAGFFGDNNTRYYYIVEDTANFNTGISITPSYPGSASFCQVARCDSVNCLDAFSQPPTNFPPVSSTPPALPLHSCPHTDVAYTITFCPSSVFPSPPPASELHPNGNRNKCVDVRGAAFANGTPVQIYDCNGTGAQKWIFNREATKVRLAGTNFCLDSTSPTPLNGTPLKIWQCFNGLPAQEWFYGPDNKLTLNGQAQCMDLTNGLLTNSNQLQTWQCVDGNANQIWTM
ncbi:ricin B-like lectin [Agrocybe pediades]|nr:ricin B-like lectin [Agrocybe pediades]